MGTGETAVAIDVGGTAMKCALVAPDGTVLHGERHSTGRERGPAAVVDAIVDVAAGLVGTARDRGLDPRAVGIVVPGVVDEANGVAVYSSNIGWRDVPFVSLIGARTGLTTALGHDVRAGAVAEARLGAGAGSDNVLFVAIGTGIAAGHVLGGRTYPGAHGAPSELGHVQVRHDGPLCGCGRYGCLEALTSAAAVARRYREAGGDGIAAAEVVARAVAGEPRAAEVWAETVEILAEGMTTALRLLDPEVVVVGGGLAEAGDALFTPLAKGMEARRAFQAMPRLVSADLGDEAGCIGAALLALDRFHAEES
ncbi:ROK family protein [Actinocatenispora rupis]|uniref:Sugar kinase n=1 Tax=Actinocatenispora rupis TaxID=519421 RepID=A0A8J3J8M6_9ACTN|nr:ROK family protein [Actinocatenispora rupis]GID13711.1 sugar kinase [Actinocatenispora rupis]